MSDKLTLGSLFSGSGGFELAGLLCGIEPIWASEIEPFPIRITTKRLPQVQHLGDINRINGALVPKVDVICGGFCCQDLSISGLRKGLHGERSGLFFQMTRIIREMLEASDYEYPKALCIENVPGLLSSAKGADFREVMDEIASLGFISDPAILDAAEFGVAQRRKRVFIVALNRRYYDPAVFAGVPNCRDKRMQKAVDAWGGETFHGIASRPHEPERQKLSEILERDVDPKYLLSEKACIGILRRAGVRGKKLPELLRIALEMQAGIYIDDAGAAASVPLSAGFCTEHSAKARGVGYEAERSPTLRAGVIPGAVVYDARGNGDGETVCTITGDHNGHISDYTALAVEPTTLKIRAGKPGGGKGALLTRNLSATLSTGNDQTLFVPTAYGISSFMSNAMLSPNVHAGIYEAETARTLDSGGGNPGCNQGGLAILDAHPVCYQDVVGALCASDYKFPQRQQIDECKAIVEHAPVTNSYTVRRLTPTECAKLQGFDPAYCSGLETPEPTEDDIAFWTDVWETHRRLMGKSSRPKSRNQIISWLQKPHADSAEYRLWGNGIPLSVGQWVLEGLVNIGL